MPNPLERLVLGAAQLGMRYGIANASGQPNTAAVAEMIGAGWSHGLRSFDTAQAYGNSEAVLGDAFASFGIAAEAEANTKLAPDVRADDPSALADSVRGSLERLRVPRLAGLMLHREAQLDAWDTSIRAAFEHLRTADLIRHAGVSVYSTDRALAALATPGIDMIQVAANIFDRRMQRAGVFERAEELGKTVFVRSIYLQGLALMDAQTVPTHIPLAVEAIDALELFCRERGIDRRQFAIGFIRFTAPQARLVLGAETPAQVEENCRLFTTVPIDAEIYAEWIERWPEDRDELIDPRTWKS